MIRAARMLRAWSGALMLLAGAALLIAGGLMLWHAQQQNARVAALTAGQDFSENSHESGLVQLASGRSLIAKGNLEAAQARADRMAATADPAPRAELLYALGNARLRRGLMLLKTQPYRKAVPMLRQAKAAYREALRLDPGNWDARYNYALTVPLLPDREDAAPTVGDEMAHDRAAWPDIPGAPNGMP